MQTKTLSFNSELFTLPSHQSLSGQPVLQISVTKQRLNRYFHSAYSKAFYSVLLLTAIFSVCWSLSKWPEYADSNWFRVLETVVIVLLFFDYCLRVLWMGMRYCISLGNLIDLMVLVVSLFALVTEIEGNLEADMTDKGTAAIIAIRSLLQFVRVIQLIKYSRSTHDPAQANLLGGARTVEQEVDDEGTDI